MMTVIVMVIYVDVDGNGDGDGDGDGNFALLVKEIYVLGQRQVVVPHNQPWEHII